MHNLGKRTHDRVLPGRLSGLALLFACYFVMLTDEILYICVLFVQLLLPFLCCNCVLLVS